MEMWRRVWPRRPARRRAAGRGGGLSLALASLVGVALALCAIRAFDGRVRPILTELARARTANAVQQVINDAVTGAIAAQAVAYTDMVTLQTDHSGQITALTSNSAAMNRLRVDILDQIITQVDALDSTQLGIPLGEIAGLATLAEQGPVLPVRVRSVGAARAEFQNVFAAAGINQTHHRILLDVTVEVTLLIPGSTVSVPVTAQVCVAETVLLGEVPQTYLQLPGQ